MLDRLVMFLFFFFNDTATTEIYTLSLHDALPICFEGVVFDPPRAGARSQAEPLARSTVPKVAGSQETATTFGTVERDRKSTRLNSSHQIISYAVFCLKKKKNDKRLHHA